MVVLGLLVSDIATYAALQQFLTQKVNDQLRNGTQDALSYVVTPQGDRFGAPGPSSGRTPLPPPFPPNSYILLRLPDGTSVAKCVNRNSNGDCTNEPLPLLPRSIPTAGNDQAIYTTVEGTRGVDHYQVLSERLDDPAIAGAVLVEAIPLTDLESTLAQLLIVELLISGLVLAGLAALAWAIIALGLRPLAQMEATAAAIAAGDLSRRVQPATPRSEIGRLGLALNAMLTQIESAFAARTRSEQRLRRFIADASHELRTPLTSIRGYAELLRRDPPPAADDARLARRRIEEESIRMSGLVNDMLLLARLDQGRPLEREPVDLRAIANDAVADAGMVAPDRQITLGAEQPVIALGDEGRLRQLVANLVRNAIVHTPPRTPIEVRVAGSGPDAVLDVVDHGPGIHEEQLGRVFEPFFRADPSRSRDSGGSGLGLSIVAAVAAAHGGSIDVVATPGGGATFRLTLPLAEERAVDRSSDVGRPSGDTAPAPVSNGARTGRRQPKTARSS